MKAYSLDLRERVAAACDEGAMSRAEVAESLAVSVSFITKLLRRRRESGTLAARPWGGNRKPALDGAGLRLLRRLVGEQPDATLAELRDRLGVAVTVWSVRRALRQLKLTYKKSRCGPPSRTARTSRGGGPSGG